MVADAGGAQDRFEFWVTTGLQASTIVVLVFFWFAAWKQGRAADKLARATRAQTDANRRMAAATDTQNEIARVQMEETFRPLLYLSWKTAGHAASLILRNDGGGPALDCAWHYGRANGHRPPTQKLEYESIAAHQEIAFGVQIHKANEEGLTILYKSVTGTACATEITWQGPHFHCRYIPDAAEHHHSGADPHDSDSHQSDSRPTVPEHIETPWLSSPDAGVTSSEPGVVSSDFGAGLTSSPDLGSGLDSSESRPRYSWLNEVPLPEGPFSETPLSDEPVPHAPSRNSASSDTPFHLPASDSAL